MADATTLTRTHPLEAWRPAFAGLSDELAATDADLTIELLPFVATLDVRLDPERVDLAVADVVGGALPTTPNTSAPIRDGRAVWLGPDEWLLTGPSTPDEESIRAVVAPLDGAAVDVSAQRTGLRLRGAGARELLRLGCALDLRPASFPTGSCAQTLLGQAGVLLVADRSDDGAPVMDVVVRTSFAGYVADWLLDAAEEFRPISYATDQEGERA
jgi:sarcosine oxidase subunit gamma